MRSRIWMSSLAAFLLVLGADVVEAQERGRGNRDGDDDRGWVQDGDERDRDRDRDERADGTLGDIIFGDDDRRDRERKGNGPPFCRNGNGHPVHGWDWCREKGWDRYGSRGVLWERRGWDDVVFRTDDRRGVLDRGGLIDVLGDVVFGRLDDQRRTLGADGPFIGQWREGRRGTALDVMVGGAPVARLVDTNADGRVDAVLLAD